MTPAEIIAAVREIADQLPDGDREWSLAISRIDDYYFNLQRRQMARCEMMLKLLRLWIIRNRERVQRVEAFA